MADEGKNDAMAEARAAAERNKKAAREAERAAEEERQRREALEQQNQNLRQQVISGALASMGAPMGLASHFPADQDPTPENVAAFVSATLGEDWQAPSQSNRPSADPQTLEAVDNWNRYDAARATTSPVPPARPDELSEINTRMNREMEAMTDLHAPKRTRTNPDEQDKARDDARVLNRLNQEQEARILSGQAEPEISQAGGFGGPYDPPRWALKVEK